MLKNALLASAMGLSIYALATGAEAGHRPVGWYVGVEGGANWIDNADIDFSPGGGTYEAEFESGWAVFAEVGYRFEDNWRLELEAGWRENDVDCIDFGPGPCVAGPWGDLSQFTQMVNLIHDIDISEHTAISVGLGFGGDFVQADSVFVRDEDFVLAGQAVFQLTHEISDRVDFVVSYRFMTTGDPEFRVAGPVSAEFENENHTVSVGFRFDLQDDASPVMAAAATPAMEPPPPPSQPRQYIVYFAFNKANLDAKAQAVVQEAAATAMHDGFVSILVTGHTDTVGSSKYNERLSARRATTVKKALVAQGVTAKAISTEGKGETILMVQTGDREMEARNRRAQIDIN
jgi:outer membrane protein OmpA-like peptidoglycan-associated protein